MKGSGEGPSVIVDLWHENGMPALRGFFPRRVDLMVRCWKENPSREVWIEVFEKIKASKFLGGGKEKKPWWLTFDWMLDHYVEILEGKYDDKNIEDEFMKYMRSKGYE